MKKTRNILKYVLIGVLLLVLALWVYIESHQPQLKGKIEMANLKKEVKVYYDTYGIPHIYASDAEDAYHAFGWVHASDRLFQMDLMRRIGRGELSEMFGPEFKKTDAFFRTLGTNRKAKADAARFDSLPEAVKLACNAYIEGINAYIEHGKIPLEYKLLGLSPRLYTLEDMYAVEAYMAWSFAYSLRTDPLVEQLYRKLGEAYMKDFDLGYPPGARPDSLFRSDSANVDSSRALNPLKVNDLPDSLPALTSQLLDLSFLDQLPAPMLQGSNSWVLAPWRSLSGKVIFANDTHIKYASPSVWYEAHIEFPGFAIYGNFLAGVPFAIVGHSRNHAWGLTMFEEDDSDFFYEKFASADTSLTVFNDSLTAPVEKTTEYIRVNGGKDTTITVYTTANGPLINAFLSKDFSRPVSMYWNYTHIPNDLVSAFYRMNNSIGIENFREGVRLIGAPGLNVTYGDAAGNIAIWSASKLIKRAEGEYGKRFVDGSSASSAFEGFYPFEKNPQEENPAVGYLYSANQYHDSTTGVAYPGYYAPFTRYDRIGERLKTMTPATVDSVKNLVTDVCSNTSAELGREIVKTIKSGNAVFSDVEKDALDVLDGWDGNHRLHDRAPTVYYATLYYILRKAMVDEMGTELFDALHGTHLLLRTYPHLLMQTDSEWWDNINTTAKVETRREIFTDAFKMAVTKTAEKLGSDVYEWKWRKVHYVEYPHPFGAKKLLRPFFNVGPFPAPGGIETVNNSGFRIDGSSDYQATFGPAMRIIIDFGDVENAVSVLPTGNSGNVMSPHYKDQAAMYVEGKFRKMLMNRAEIDSVSTLVVMEPKM